MSAENAQTTLEVGLLLDTEQRVTQSVVEVGHNPDASQSVSQVIIEIPYVVLELVRLTWTDNSDNEAGFIIERDDGAGFVEIANVAPNTTQYDDSVQAGTYTYRVFSYLAGDLRSDPSNEVEITVT